VEAARGQPQRIGSRPDNTSRFDVEKWGSTHPGLNRAPGLAQAARLTGCR
jgi:hypothetical protein